MTRKYLYYAKQVTFRALLTCKIAFKPENIIKSGILWSLLGYWGDLGPM